MRRGGTHDLRHVQVGRSLDGDRELALWEKTAVGQGPTARPPDLTCAAPASRLERLRAGSWP